jgi:hypothetical protein
MELYCTPKVNTLQLNTASNFFEHAYMSDPHGPETLTPIEFFQQGLLWQSSNTHFHSYSQKASKHTSGYWSTCNPQRHLGVYIFNPPFANKLTCSSHNFRYNCTRPISRPDCTSVEVRRQQSRYYGTQLQLVYIVAWQLKVRLSIVAYLRKPHICNNN